MSAIKNPLDAPVDKVRFAGRFDTPGLCEIIGANSPRKWEEWTAGGWSGGVLFFRGFPLSHFSIRLSMYTTQDWADWEKFRPLVMRRPVGKGFPGALDVSHPFLAELGITACVIEDVRAPDQIEHGVWQIELMCIEHRKLRAASGKAEGSEAEPVDPWEAKVEHMRQRVEAEKGELDQMLKEGNLP